MLYLISYDMKSGTGDAVPSLDQSEIWGPQGFSDRSG